MPKRPARPRKARHDGWTDHRRAAFLEALGESGCFNDAARLIGISRMSVWRLRERDPGFDAACKEKQRASVGLLRDIATARALSRRKVTVYDEAGNVVAHRTQIDDRMLIFLLNRYDLSDRPTPRPRMTNYRLATRVMPEGEKQMRRRMALVRGMEADIIMDELDARLDGVDELEDLFAEGEGNPAGTRWYEEKVEAVPAEEPAIEPMPVIEEKVTYCGNEKADGKNEPQQSLPLDGGRIGSLAPTGARGSWMSVIPPLSGAPDGKHTIKREEDERGSPSAHHPSVTRLRARHLPMPLAQGGSLVGAWPMPLAQGGSFGTPGLSRDKEELCACGP